MVWLQTIVKDNCEHTVPEYTSTLSLLDWALDFDIVIELIVQCKRKLSVLEYTSTLFTDSSRVSIGF